MRESWLNFETFGSGRVSFHGDAKLKPKVMTIDRIERRQREKEEVLMRLRRFAERTKWKKARLSRELGVSISTLERWLAGQENIFLASVLAIRGFLEKRESPAEVSERIERTPRSNQ
jgi:hypothetical protein